MAVQPFQVDDFWIQQILESLKGLQYGSVHIVVHDGQIVLIERTVKNRFANTAKSTTKEGRKA